MAFSDLKKTFEENGYAILKDFLDEDEIESLKKACWKIVDEMNPEEHSTVFSTLDMDKTNDDYFMTSGDKIRFFFEDGAMDEKGKLKVDKHLSINKIGHALHVLDPVFKKVTFSEKMKKLAKALELEDPAIVQSMYIFKQPKIGGEVVPHQDSTFLYTEPLRLIGVWIALEDATIDNSCLWFMPNSHKDGVHDNRRMIRNTHQSETGKGTIFTSPPVSYDEDKFIPCEVKKGTLVAIHGEVVHKSLKNTSEKSRHIYTFHMYDTKNTIYSKENWLQPTESVPFPHLYSEEL